MKKIIVFFLLAIAIIHTSALQAQESNRYTPNNTTNKQEVPYYVDRNGTPYYVDKRGYKYYKDENGHPYYLDQKGRPYYLDKNGTPYYLDKEGYAYYIDNNGNPYYIDQRGVPYYLDKNGKPYYPNQPKIVESDKYRNEKYGQSPDNTTIANNRAISKPEQTRPIEPQNETKELPKPERQIYVISKEYDKFRAAIGAGYTFRLGKRTEYNDNPAQDKVSKDLMHGFNIDADAQYFFNPTLGLGLNFNYVTTSSSINDIKQQFMYVGPSFVGRSDIGNTFLLIYNAGVGPIFFTESSSVESNYTQTTIGANIGISGEYKIDDNWGVGLRISGTLGSINSYKHDGIKYNLEKRRNVSSLNITGFLSFRSK